MERIQFIDEGLGEEESNKSLEVFSRWNGLAKKYWQATGDRFIDLGNIQEYFTKVVDFLVRDKEFRKDLTKVEFLTANYYQLLVLKETNEYMDIIDEAYILTAFAYYRLQVPEIVNFMVNYDDDKKREVYEWLRVKSRYYLYSSLLGSVINKFKEKDMAVVDGLDILIEKVSKRKDSLALLLGTEKEEKSLTRITKEEFDFLVKDFFRYIETPASWNEIYEEIKANKIIKFEKTDGISKGVCYFDSGGVLRISLLGNGTINDVVTFIHEFTHYMRNNQKNQKTFSFLDELGPIYMETLVGEYLESRGYGDNLSELFLRRHQIDDIKAFMKEESLLKDLIAVKNGKFEIKDSDSENGELIKSGKVKFERRKTSLDRIIGLDRDKRCDESTNRILKEGLRVFDSLGYFIGTMVTEEIRKRPKEEVWPVILDIIGDRQYPLDRLIESLNITIFQPENRENTKDVLRTLKKK